MTNPPQPPMFGWGKKSTAAAQTPAPPAAKPQASAKPAAATNESAKPAPPPSNSNSAAEPRKSTAAPSRLESTHSSCSSVDMVEGSGVAVERSESYERALKMAYKPPKDSMVVIPAGSSAPSVIDPSFYTHMSTYAPTAMGQARSSCISTESKAPPKKPPQVQVPVDSPSPQKPSPRASPSPPILRKASSSEEVENEYAEARAQIAKAKSRGRVSFSERSTAASEAEDAGGDVAPLKQRLQKLEKEHAALKEEVAALRAERAADRAWMEERLKQATALQRKPSRLPGMKFEPAIGAAAPAPAPAPAGAGMPNPRAIGGVSARKASAAVATLSSPRKEDSPIQSALQTFARSAKNLLAGADGQTEPAPERASVKV